MRALRPVARLWREVPEEVFVHLAALMAGRQATVFFRADDIAVPSLSQDRLLRLFVRHQVPLCAAIVPTWMTRERWQGICNLVGDNQHLFAWHQHGWNHRNHQPFGKKQEFGSGLAAVEKARLIAAGQARLVDILGERFLPVFTPPWNRVDFETLEALQRQGFAAISRYRGDRLRSLPGLPDLAVNVDLHTRKEENAELAWQGLFAEFEQALTSGMVGLMLHHQRMNETAFVFLERFMEQLVAEPGLRLVHFGTLLGGDAENFLPTLESALYS